MLTTSTPASLQQPRGLDRPLDADAARRVDLDRDHEPARCEELGEAGRRRPLLGRSVPSARAPGPRSCAGRRAAAGGRRRRAAASALDRRGRRRSSAARMAATCAGVVPQQPPTIRAPTASMRGVTLGEVVGARRVDEAALEPLRQPGVGHDRAGTAPSAGGAAHPLEGVDRGTRAGAAVDPDHVHAGGDERRGRHLRARAVGEREVLAERERRDDRDVGGLASLLDREQQLVEIRERLEHEDVGAAFEQAVDVLPEDRPRALLARPRRAARWRARSGRPSRRRTPRDR